MTNRSRPRSSLRSLISILGLAIWLAGCGQADKQKIQDSHMTRSKMTLWQAIDALAQQVPFTKAKIESLLSTQFVETGSSPNGISQYFESHSVTLSDGVVIETVDLRTQHQSSHPGFMVLKLSGPCISFDMVRSHYGNLEVTDVPRGRSLEESTTHSTTLPWGRLSFSFKERNPGCLASVTFKPKQEE
ncbi:hypothetical protein CJO75_00075 [Ralstonia solanacearum]|uniref:hypothetical protein n=1 Tax=Ralstonia pseudosolanacearum TaxID=1310165 RepID=UPI0009BEBAE7|nr:hypothetical protein CJO75_00075 [Ralstonia solanacearum]AXW13627.1 hypothetical protein CJO84_00075 [Ralstonia solanacearum]AXW36831.1 hypothetical protein CJO89_00075 [Ralstonia solanacearum]AXW69700.1 hypothetical protein CJO96_00180 [Ralstonia solanacearum]